MVKTCATMSVLVLAIQASTLASPPALGRIEPAVSLSAVDVLAQIRLT
ncbi:MAG: hypothetical protein SGJ09_08380 [Phycisphaerae bacterium]|nr:hypothetical protein [Phycisphaerae bacterium]